MAVEIVDEPGGRGGDCGPHRRRSCRLPGGQFPRIKNYRGSQRRSREREFLACLAGLGRVEVRAQEPECRRPSKVAMFDRIRDERRESIKGWDLQKRKDRGMYEGA